MPPPPQLTNDETIALISNRAKQDGNNFVVKIYRKRSLGSHLETVASLGEATVEQVANPETWLPRLCGGGPTYMLAIYHTNDTTQQIGGFVQVNVPLENCPPRPIADIDCLKSPGWKGPTLNIWAAGWEEGKPQQQSTPYIPSPLGFGQAVTPAPSASPVVSDAMLQVQRLQEQLARQSTEMQAAQRAMDDEKRRLERESDRREAEERNRAFKAEIAAQLSSVPRDTSTALDKILPALAPVLTQFMQSQNEMRMMMLKLDADRAAQQQQMMSALLNRPAVDPVMLALLKDKSGQSDPEMMRGYSEAMHSMSKMSMDLVRTAADLNVGQTPRENPTLAAIKEAVKAVNAISMGYAASVQDKMHQKAGGPPPNYSQQALAAPPPNLQVVPNLPTPIAQVAEATPPRRTVLDDLEDKIKAHTPVAEVAKMFLDAAQGDADMQAALEEYGGDFKDLFAARVGGWAMSDPALHAPYVKALLDEVNRQGLAAGVFEDEEEGEEVEGEATQETAEAV